MWRFSLRSTGTLKQHFLRGSIRTLHEQADMKLPHNAMVTCLPGLEPILSKELRSLGIDHQTIKHGAMLIEPSLRAIFQCNLYLGTASNILLRCGESFSARGLPEIRRKAAKLPWTEILQGNQVRLEARVITSKSKLHHSTAIEARVIAAVYEALGYEIPMDRFTLEYPPSIQEDDPLVRLEVQITRDQVDIWLYASTTPLHRRGYRLQTAKAPLREDLAYAMLYGSGWLPAWNPDPCPYEILLDPMCGSGTIAIEGAAMAVGLAPGRLRPPPLEGTQMKNNLLHQELLTINSQQAIAVKAPMVFASDRDMGGIKATRLNAERASVLDYLSIENCALSDHPLWAQQSSNTKHMTSKLVATNPPFGKRVSKNSKKDNDATLLLPLYQSLKKRVDNSPKTHAVLLAQGTYLVHRSGWKGDEIFQSTHGGLSVTALRYKPATSD